jgi:hypothetical protein
METEIKSRFVTLVRTRSITNCITGYKQNFADTYGVYDNLKECECVFISNFKPRSYEDVKAKAEELNTKYEATEDKEKFFYL